MIDATQDTATPIPAGKSRIWNDQPALPIRMSPVFDIPPRPNAALAWIAGTWPKVTPPVNHLVFAVVTYMVLWPAMPLMQAQNWTRIA